MLHEVRVVDLPARPTAVLRATTTWAEFPSLWMGMLDQVWTCLRAGGIDRGCPNVMLYLNDVPDMEVGVLLDQPCELTGAVVRSSLPAGRVANTTHRGSYAGLASAHDEVVAWCHAQGLTTAGPRWEIYGPHRDDPAEVTIEVYWLLA